MGRLHFVSRRFCISLPLFGCILFRDYLRLAHLCGTGSDRKRPGRLDTGRISFIAGVAAATAQTANTKHATFI